jgi:ribose-phosphate pyrophosphokinase
VLGSEQLRVAQEGKRMGGAEPRVAAWTPKTPAPEARLAALPRELRDSRMKIFSGTANHPLAQVGLASLTLFVRVGCLVP